MFMRHLYREGYFRDDGPVPADLTRHGLANVDLGRGVGAPATLATNPRGLVLVLVLLGWAVPRLRQWREERSLKRWLERQQKG